MRRPVLRPLPVLLCSIAMLAALAPATGSLAGSAEARLDDRTAPPAVAPTVSPPAADAPSYTTVRDLWYRLLLGGAPCGWMNVRVDEAPGRYRTVTAMRMAIERGEQRVEIGTTTTWEETRDGEPLRIEMMQVTGAEPVYSEYVFGPRGVSTTTRQGGRQMRDDLPLPTGDWLTPMEVERFTAERRAAGAATIEYETIDGQQGLKPVRVTETRGEQAVRTIDGREIPVTVWRTRTSTVPVDVTAHVTEDNRLVYSAVDFAFGELETVLSTRSAALEVGAAPLPEVMVASFVRPDRPIDRVASRRRLDLRLRATDGTLPALPSAGVQHASTEDGWRTARLRIDLDDVLPAEPGELDDPVYLAASPMVDIEDPFVASLAKSALQTVKAEGAAARAEGLRAYVHRYIRGKGLATALATASEIARRREGDCTEHAVLLTALLRANGIPARVASGLVYADAFAGSRDIFAWHMWTQALVDGKWVDLDATLDVPFHPGHVLVATSPLSGTAMDDALAATVILIGNLEIDVVE